MPRAATRGAVGGPEWARLSDGQSDWARRRLRLGGLRLNQRPRKTLGFETPAANGKESPFPDVKTGHRLAVGSTTAAAYSAAETGAMSLRVSDLKPHDSNHPWESLAASTRCDLYRTILRAIVEVPEH
jgi:hypothetical protein